MSRCISVFRWSFLHVIPCSEMQHVLFVFLALFPFMYVSSSADKRSHISPCINNDPRRIIG